MDEIQVLLEQLKSIATKGKCKMNDIDYTDLKLIDNFEYDIHPNERGEIMIAFKYGEDSFVMPIPKQDLESMLWFAKQK